jgi:hypothetical protein
LDSWEYFTASDLRLPFSSPPTTRRVTVEVFSNPPLLSVHLYRRGTDTDLQKTSRDRYPASPSALAGPTENTCHMTAKHCCVTSLPMRKLHRHRKHCCCIVGRVCVAGVVWQWIYMSQYVFVCVLIVQSSMQVHRLLVASPLSPCFHVNSRHISTTQGHHQVYIMVCLNFYTMLRYYIDREDCSFESWLY